MQNETVERARQIIAEAAERDAGEIEPEQDLLADLGIDSPKALKLLMDLEEALDVEISDEDAARMESVGDVLDFVVRVASAG